MSELPGKGDFAEAKVAGDEVYAEASAALDEGGTAVGDVEDVAGVPAEPSQSGWSGGESAATLLDSPAASSGHTSQADPFALKAVPVAANAETPDDPDELVTGDTQVPRRQTR